MAARRIPRAGGGNLRVGRLWPYLRASLLVFALGMATNWLAWWFLGPWMPWPAVAAIALAWPWIMVRLT